ncbi:MFS transporter [Saccharopolyspora tripterygii]
MSSPSTDSPTADPKTLRRVVGAGFLGTTIEYYDFFIYGTAAALVFPKVFFPELGAAAATTASFATFAVAFVARPFGGVVFGHLGDRVGRKTTLVATLLIMGVSTVLIGVLPTGATIGVAAPILLVALRFLQGLAVGGEWSSAALFVGEYAPPRKRGLYALAPTLGTSAGLLLSTLTFLVTGFTMSTETFLTWGWRLPFLLSVVLVFVGLWVRLGVADTPVFRAAQERAAATEKAKLPITELLRHQWKQMLLAAGAILFWQPFFTIASVFLVNYGTAEVGHSRNTMLTINIVAILFNIAGSIIGGRLADRIGRRRSMLISTSFGVIWAFALFPLADTGSPVLMGLGISATLFFVGISSSAMTAFMPELFRTAYRSTGTGAAFNLGSAVGASVPSIIAAPLLAAFGGIGVAVMLSAFAFAATVSVAFLNETRGRSLDDTATTTAARPAADAV